MNRPKNAGTNQKPAQNKEYDYGLVAKIACAVQKAQGYAFALYIHPINQQQMPRMHQKYGERSDAADRVQVRRCSRAQTLIVRLLQELLELGHNYLFGKSTLFGRSASWEEPARQVLPNFLDLRPRWKWPYLPAEHPLPDEAVIKSA